MNLRALQKPKFKMAALVLAVYIAYLSFGLHHLTKFATADETIWWLYDRVPAYWTALLSGDWEKTYINDKPGVSVALISGIGYNLSRDNFQEQVAKRLDAPNGYKRVEAQDLNVEKNFFALRLPLLIFNGMFAFFLFWLIRKITSDQWTAFWAFSFILLSPIILGISQIVNPDTLLWTFSAGCLLSFLVFLKTEQGRYAVSTSLCLGMALLSKYAATILFPFLIIVSLLHLASRIGEWKEQNEDIPKRIRATNLAVLAIIAGSVAVFAVGMPAALKIRQLLWEGTIGFPGMEFFLWPLLFIQGMLLAEHFLIKNRYSIILLEHSGKIFRKYSHLIYWLLAFSFLVALLNWMTDLRLFNIKDVAFDMGKSSKFGKYPLYRKIVYEIRPLIFSLTPLVLFSLLFFWISSAIKKAFNFTALVFSLFIIIFYSAVIFEGLMVTIRYSIVLYPLVMIMAAMGIKELYSLKIFKNINIYSFTLVLIMMSASSLWFTRPFYFNYTNFLLPQNRLITGAWGYGGYEAAQYLNSLPDAEKLVIWSDYPGVCEFTKGKCYITNRIENKDIDYFVLTRRGRITFARKGDRTGAQAYYQKNGPAWELFINGRPGNYIRVFKNEK